MCIQPHLELQAIKVANTHTGQVKLKDLLRECFKNLTTLDKCTVCAMKTDLGAVLLLLLWGVVLLTESAIHQQ